jgi:aspartate racemase
VLLSVGEILADEARALEAAGVDLLVLCTNTMHKVADALTAAVDVPLLHIGDVTGAAVAAASRQTYREVVERLVARGAEGVVLGCTEIELLIGPDDVDVPVFPTTALHVEAAVDAALA